MRNWKRRTIVLWAAVLLLIGTEAPALGGGHWTGAIEPEETVKAIPKPELLAAAVGPELPAREAGGPVLPPLLTADMADAAAAKEAAKDTAAADTAAADTASTDTAAELSSSDTVPEPLENGESAAEEVSEPVTADSADSADDTDNADSADNVNSADNADSANNADSTNNAERTDNAESADASLPDPLKTLGDNEEKRLFLFGDGNWGRRQVYETEEEAATHMTDVEVPVWTLWKGVKSQGTMRLTVHQALAEDVKEIFTEIFQDPEQFPVQSMGGFRYRTGTYGEHNNGTAVDLNADQNFQVRDGAALTGSCWEPGVNPFSIPEDGSVVRIFKEHGWSWGGDAWEDSADASTGYHDYMHFSYRGM